MASPGRPALSIIIAARNNAGELAACLPSLPRGGSDRYEVIVVDNGSTDGTPAILRDSYPDVIVIVNRSNLGHCRAINQGLAAASADLVLVIDADTFVWPGATERLVALLRAHPEAVIAAPRILNSDGSLQETARAFPRPINALFGRQTFLTRVFPRNRFSARYLDRAHAGATEPFEVEWVSAACMLFRRSLMASIGGWDEGFRGYWVDADWCRRARAAGRIYCEPSARITHVEQHRSGRKKDATRIIQFHMGAARFYRKHDTRGWLDPRALAACSALAARAALLVLANALRRSDPIAAAAAPGTTRGDRGGEVLTIEGRS